MTARTHRPLGRPHIPQEDPATPGVCLTCQRPVTARNTAHLTSLTPQDAAVTQAEARRLGESTE